MTGPEAAIGEKSEDPIYSALAPAVTRSMQEVVPYGVLTTDLELRITSWNRWLSLHSGMTPTQVLGRALLDVYPEVEERRLHRFKSALAGEISVLSAALHKYLLPLPTSHTEAGGHMLQTAWIAPLRQGSATIGTIAIIEDVTQRELQTSVLHRQQELDRLLSEALGALLRSVDPSHDLPQILPMLMPALGLDVYLSYLLDKDQMSMRLSAAGGLAPAQREALATLELTVEDASLVRNGPATATPLSRYHATLDAMGLSFRCSLPLVVGDRLLGLVSFGSYYKHVIAPGDQLVLSRVAQYVAIALDRWMREREILAASRAKDDFLAALSHELRTPLNPVLLLASDCADNPAFSSEARDAFRVIEKNALLEARLIDDLLDLTRIERGKTSLDLQLLDVQAVLADAVVTVRSEVDAAQLMLTVALEEKECHVRADAARLQQVFWNLLKNSIRFTPAGGSIIVSSRTDSTNQLVVIEITDTGIGIEATDLEKIFGAFIQAQRHSQRINRFGGLGLGLAISRQLVELHGGQIQAHSAGLNQGSTFTVTLPLALQQAPFLSTPSSAAKAAILDVEPEEPGQVPPGRCILLVEDHEPTRLPLSRLLRKRGYDVVAVGTVAEALLTADTTSVDLVVSDIGLPDGDGLELMKALRDKHSLRGIALTGYGMDEDIARTRDAGYIAHLTKPISTAALDRALHGAFA